MRLRLPPIPDQRAIAHVLSTIDDRIELNRRMNTTLDAMARAFFKSWFVDFDPVRTKAAGRPPAGMDTDTATLFPSEFERSGCGDIPKGWTIGPLANLASLNPESWTRSSRPAEIKYVDLSHPLI